MPQWKFASSFIFIVCLLAGVGAPAQQRERQNRSVVNGTVTDSLGNPLSGATIHLLSGTDSLSKIAGPRGTFTFNIPPKQRFRLIVTALGYRPFSQEYSVPAGSTQFDLGDIPLVPLYQQLQTATVSRVRPITSVPDTLTYNARAFPTQPGVAVVQLLRRLPGLEVDINGNVSINGTRITKVIVNGKEYMGGDVLFAIMNLPADIVEKIQIIDDYGDDARLTNIKVGEPRKILNIVFPQNLRTGMVGHLTAGEGTEGKFSDDIFANLFRPTTQTSLAVTAVDNSQLGENPVTTIDFGYSGPATTPIDAALNANYHIEHPHLRTTTAQTTSLPADQLNLSQTATTESVNKNFSAAGIFTVHPVPSSTLRLTTGLSLQHSTSTTTSNTATLETTYFTKTTLDQQYDQAATINTSPYADLYFEHISPKTGQRYSMQASLNYNTVTNRHTTIAQNTTTIGDTITNAVQQFTVNNPLTSLSLAVAGQFLWPLAPQTFFRLGYSAHRSRSDLTRTTVFPDSNQLSLLSDSLNLRQRYITQDQSLQAGLRLRRNAFQLLAQLDLRLANMDNEDFSAKNAIRYQYMAPLPTVEAGWALSPAARLTFNYHGDASAPGSAQLAPVTDITNPQFPVTGNPHLTPSYSEQFALHYEKSALKALTNFGFGATAGYNVTTHPIVNVINHPADSSAVIATTTYINGQPVTSAYASGQVSAPPILQKHLRLFFNTTIARSTTDTYADGNRLPTTTIAYTQTIHLLWQIEDLHQLDIQATHSSENTAFQTGTQASVHTQTANLTLAGRDLVFNHWTTSWQYTQPFESEADHLISTPAMLTAGIERTLLRKNAARISLTLNNILNSGSAASQQQTPTSITHTTIQYTQRYFLLTFRLQLEKFRH